MSDLKKIAIRLLKKYDIRPKRRMGQTFIINPYFINKIVDAAELQKNDVVLEIGGGLGFLTKAIAKRVKKVISIEIDKRLISAMREYLKDLNNVEIVYADALKIKFPKVNKIVSNLPFSISTQITFKILKEIDFELAVLTYQKEVVERMLAKPGSPNYGRLTIMVNFYANIEPLFLIPKYNFYPIPEVDAFSIRMVKKSLPYSLDFLELFDDLVRVLFTQRNKKWSKVLRRYLKEKGMNVQEINNIFSKLKEIRVERVRELSIDDLINITNTILQFKGSSHNISTN